MSIPRENPNKTMFADPEHPVGNIIYRLGEHRYTHLALPIAFVGLFAGVFAASKSPDWLAATLMILGFAVMFLGMFVSQAADEEICPECSNTQPDVYGYCANCGIAIREHPDYGGEPA